MPLALVNSLSAASAVAWAGPPAQNAQRCYRVPASFLIAVHVLDYGWDCHAVSTQGDRFPGERHFLQEAKYLATNRKFRSALKVADSPLEYARQIAARGYFKGTAIELSAVAGFIVDHSLFECDWRYGAKDIQREVRIDEAARILSLPVASICSLLRAGAMYGWEGREDTPGYVYYRSLKSYEQRQLLKRIEADEERQLLKKSVAGAKPKPVTGRGDRPRNVKLLAFPVLSSMQPAVEAVQ